MKIIYEDNNIILLNKKPGIPSQPDKTGNNSLYDDVKAYTNSDVYIINRLDRPVSGIVLFAKNKEAAKLYSESISLNSTRKVYYAIVDKKPKREKDTLTDYLYKRNNKAYVANKSKQAKKVELKYEYICSSERYHFIKVILKTGRFHQIRVQLANIGCHIKGDVKYGSRRSNKDRSIGLHGYQLSIFNPTSKTNKNYTAEFPDNVLWNELSKHL